MKIAEGCGLLLFNGKTGNPTNTAGCAVPTLLLERKVTTNTLRIMFQQTVSPLKRKAQVNLERYERRKQSKRVCLPMDVTEGVTAGDQANPWTREVRMFIHRLRKLRQRIYQP